nr:polysaccharide deacetylase family protein [uncultured Aminipila sp.]
MLLKSLYRMGICAAIGYSIIPTCCYKAKQRLCIPNTEEKKLYLTFDDGPDKRFTGKLLDLLNKYNIKVTFFVVARFAENNTDIIERMKQEGHLIGFHSLEHRNALCQTPKYTRDDFKQSQEIFKKLGVKIKFFRPPWGHLNIETLNCVKNYRFKTILWDVMAEDWRENTTWKEIAQKLMRRTKQGDIICLHDGRGKNDAPGRTIDALEEVLPIWISQGYKFARMDDVCIKKIV